MSTPFWFSNNETNAKFDAGSFRCPGCGEYTRSVVTGYGIGMTFYSVLSFGRRFTWRRVCCSCGHAEKITKREAKEAAIKNYVWPDYIDAVRNKTPKYIGIFLSVIGLLLIGILIYSDFSPLHYPETEALGELEVGDRVSFVEVYPDTYYSYETDEEDEIVSHSYACYYYDEDDELALCSLRVEPADDVSVQLLRFAEDKDGLIGDISIPVYGSVKELDPDQLAFFREYSECVAEYIDADVYEVDIEYISAEFEKTSPDEYILCSSLLAAGLVLIGIYYIAYNPNRPPKSKEKPLGEL